MSVNSPPPNDLPLSFYLVKTCKLWVWDFDDTLINIETYVRRDMKPNTIRNLLDSDLDVDFPQWRYFKRLIDFLVTHGKYVGIASFGTYEIIRAYMDRIFGFNQKFFGKQNIVAPCMADRDNRRFSVPPNKNEYIYQLMKIYRVQDFERVVLFDDLPSNISSATAIGVVAVQIATPRNGDRDPSKMYFGPWIMSDLDNKLKDSCCNSQNNSKENLINTVSFKGDTFNYIKSAYGTGIGDRKISKKPEHRWNRMNVQNPPLWQNGNWQTNGGNRTMETIPIQDSTLGGFSYSYWDDHQSVSSPKPSMNNYSNMNNNSNNKLNNSMSSNVVSDSNIEGFQSRYNDNDINSNDNDINSNDNNSNDNDNYNNVSGYNKNYIKYKKIGNRNSKVKDIETCNSCKKITWDWITLSLMVIIFMMVALCFSIM